MGAGDVVTIAGFAGSLRKASFNRALLRAAVEAAPAAGLRIEVCDLSEVPLYNGDVEALGLPEAVQKLRAAVTRADGLLIATPEYNWGVPAVTKNALDWLSRPPKPVPLDGRPAAIMGASPGGFGTVRSQLLLRQSLVATNTPTLPQPQILVAKAHEKFDAAGVLTDGATRTMLSEFLEQFARWVRRMKG